MNTSPSKRLRGRVFGIVFWGIALIGMSAVVLLVNERARGLDARYEAHASILAVELSRHIEQGHSRTEFKAALEKLSQRLGFEAVVLRRPDADLHWGERLSGQTRLRRVLDGAADDELFVYFPGAPRALAGERRRLLLSWGVVVLVFSFALQHTMRVMFTRPLLRMVETARSITKGQSGRRFDEHRDDEFGFLATFINRALQSLLGQQAELEGAVSRLKVSEQALLDEKQRAEVTLRSINDAVVATDEHGRISYANPAAERLSGCSAATLIGRQAAEALSIVHEDTRTPLGPIERCVARNRAWRLERHAVLIVGDDTVVPIEGSAAPMYGDAGEILGAVLAFHDVSHARKLAHQLSYQAGHDALTGLLNRRMFEEHLEQALTVARGEERHSALCYLDLDHFKIINDTCGHVAGDELLRQVASVLEGNVREEDVLARLGGDEFGVLLRDCRLPQAQAVAEKLRRAVKETPFFWEGTSFSPGVSIGLAGLDTHCDDVASAFSAADLACYVAKDTGRDRVHVYEPTDVALKKKHGEMHWVSRIKRAADEHRLVLYSQPIVPTSRWTEDLGLAEVLIRMKDERGELVRPGIFLSAAERYNLMPSLDRWVVETALTYLSEATNSVALSINLSGASLSEPEFLDFLRTISQEHSALCHRVCFEITETAVVRSIADLRPLMSDLRAMGCRFALDDFGKGLSSFAYLRDLAVDFLKIDGSFVRNIVTDHIDRALVESIVQTARIMKIETIAEWVEEDATRRLLEEIGVDYVQGYGVAEPASLGSSPNARFVNNPQATVSS